jgi:hypothetical protein
VLTANATYLKRSFSCDPLYLVVIPFKIAQGTATIPRRGDETRQEETRVGERRREETEKRRRE